MPGKLCGSALLAVVVVSFGAGAACSGGDGGGSALPRHLSELNVFAGDIAAQQPVEGVVRYEVNSAAFADFAAEHRFIQLAPGGRILYDPSDRWQFPTGSLILETFGYPHDFRDPSMGERVVETRVLRREDVGWSSYVYVWNEEQTEATQIVAGARVAVQWIDAQGNAQTLGYRVPNTNQCATCHGRGMQVSDVLGLRTIQMERDHDYGSGPENQIDHLAMLDLFVDPPDPPDARARLEPPLGGGPLESRARAYLEANCGHCHRPGGAAAASGLSLDIETTDPAQLGICKIPFAAGRATGGRAFDIVPGRPDESVMIFRVEASEPGIKMPLIPIQLVDPDGVALLREWITSLGDGCH